MNTKLVLGILGGVALVSTVLIIASKKKSSKKKSSTDGAGMPQEGAGAGESGGVAGTGVSTGKSWLDSLLTGGANAVQSYLTTETFKVGNFNNKANYRNQDSKDKIYISHDTPRPNSANFKAGDKVKIENAGVYNGEYTIIDTWTDNENKFGGIIIPFADIKKPNMNTENWEFKGIGKVTKLGTAASAEKTVNIAGAYNPTQTLN